MAVPQEVLDKLTEFDSPTICNVIELFEVRLETPAIWMVESKLISRN